jgi:acyl-homoserine lactone acylase PvdQ
VPDYARIARNILPSGQYGGVPVPPEADRQARMYDALTPLFDDVDNGHLFNLFKSERLDTKGQAPLRTQRPRKGVRIVRDAFNVPHIYGKTDDDVTFGAGWALAQDRALLLEQVRYNARVAAVDAPGLNAIRLVVGLKSFVPSVQTEREVAKEAKVLRRRYGRRGRRFLHDIDVFVKGINAQYRTAGNPAKPWTRNT